MSAPQSTQELAEAALTCADRGWPVIPLHHVTVAGCSCSRGAACPTPGKHPRITLWVTNASTDPGQVRSWWRQWPHANVGLLTGSRSGVLVLDEDPRHGGDEALKDLERQYGTLPDTVVTLTGGGGRHFWFQYPPHQHVRSCSAFGGHLGLDVRGEGGLIVVPPSIHASGRRYEWEASGHPGDLPLAAVPEWLIRWVSDDNPTQNASQRRTWARGVAEGSRNIALASIAGQLLARGVDPHLALQLCYAWNQTNRPPLSDDEVWRTVNSIARAELSKRREGEA